MSRLIKAIKKALATHKEKQEQIKRQAHNREQAKLIIKALEERDY